MPRVLPAHQVDTLTLSPDALLVFPTDTVYGIGARTNDTSAIRRLRALKARSLPKPFSLHLGKVEDIALYAELSKRQTHWIHELLPGPYTVLLQAGHRAPKDAVLEGKVGLRVPGGKNFLSVYGAFGPLLGTSVNEVGAPPLNDPDAIVAKFGRNVCGVVLACESLSGQSSAILDLTQTPPVALRGKLPTVLQEWPKHLEAA